MRTPLRPIDNIKLLQRELQLISQSLDFSLQLARFQRCEFVEQRKNPDRVDSNHGDLDTDGEGPEVEEEVCTERLNDLEESCQDWCAEDDGKSLTLYHIG